MPKKTKKELVSDKSKKMLEKLYTERKAQGIHKMVDQIPTAVDILINYLTGDDGLISYQRAKVAERFLDRMGMRAETDQGSRSQPLIIIHSAAAKPVEISMKNAQEEKKLIGE
jgi:hypothetical protein